MVTIEKGSVIQLIRSINKNESLFLLVSWHRERLDGFFFFLIFCYFQDRPVQVLKIRLSFNLFVCSVYSVVMVRFSCRYLIFIYLSENRLIPIYFR